MNGARIWGRDWVARLIAVGGVGLGAAFIAVGMVLAGQALAVGVRARPVAGRW